MKRKNIVGLIVIIVAIALIAMLAWHIEEKARIEELSKMALTEADLPGDYVLEDEGPFTKFDKFEQVAGGIIGYGVVFSRTDSRTDGKIYIFETIVICSHPDYVPYVEGWYISSSSIGPGSLRYQITELPNPDIGEWSKATRWVKIFGNKLTQESELRLTFVKNDKWVRIVMRGSEDYEVLKELATKAEKKIE